jgi:hypothetical protein
VGLGGGPGSLPADGECLIAHRGAYGADGSEYLDRYLLTEARDRAGNAVHYAYAMSPRRMDEYRHNHIGYTDHVMMGESGA